jgi:sugar lactone lactonase YvrE
MTQPRHLLLVSALALAACAAPATLPPSPTPLPATDTPAPPTARPTATAPTALHNFSVKATAFALGGPNDIVFGPDGSMYVSECFGPQVLKIANGLLTAYAGLDAGDFAGDGGPALTAGMNCAVGLAFDGEGNLYVADSGNNRIRRIDASGRISTYAGSGPGATQGSFGGDGGPATQAQLWNPSLICFDAQGNLFIDDTHNDRIRKVDRQGIITTVVGNGTTGFAGDGGPATEAELALNTGLIYETPGLAFDARGQLYLSDSNNNRVRRVDENGIITTIAGNGGDTVTTASGQAISATLSSPNGLAFDADGNLYIATGDAYLIHNDSIRKVDAQGTMTTFAGVGWPDYSGDDGPALQATINEPAGIRFDTAGDLYIADFVNNRIRMIDKSGIITTIAGGVP